MAYLIAASPLSKLFMQEYQAKCEAEADFVFSDEPFEVTIPRSSGAIVMTYKVPVLANKLLRFSPNQQRDEFMHNALENMVVWLTGGKEGTQSLETDIYGVVELMLDLDVGADLLSIANNKNAAKDLADLKKAIDGNAKVAMKNAFELADSRVRRALKTTHRNLMKQFETMKTDGKGFYTPSVAESIGAHILKAEVDKASKSAKEAMQRVVGLHNDSAGMI